MASKFYNYLKLKDAMSTAQKANILMSINRYTNKMNMLPIHSPFSDTDAKLYSKRIGYLKSKLTRLYKRA